MKELFASGDTSARAEFKMAAEGVGSRRVGEVYEQCLTFPLCVSQTSAVAM